MRKICKNCKYLEMKTRGSGYCNFQDVVVGYNYACDWFEYRFPERNKQKWNDFYKKISEYVREK